MTTYSIIRRGSLKRARRGLSAKDAAYQLLTHNGREFEIREEVGRPGFGLWHRRPNEGRSVWEKTFIVSELTERDAAETEIFNRAILSKSFEEEDRSLYCLNDEALEEWMANIAAMEAELAEMETEEILERENRNRGAEFDLERRRLGLSIKEVAAVCGVTERTVNRWIRNEQRVSYSAWEELSEIDLAMDLDLGVFLDHAGEMDHDSGAFCVYHFRTEAAFKATFPETILPLGAHAMMTVQLVSELENMGFEVRVEWGGESIEVPH